MSPSRFVALAGAVAICVGATAAQASVSYEFSLDTSSLAGANGFIELQFANGGSFGVQQEATATISGFQIAGGALTEADPYAASDLFGAPNVFGQVSGTLPGAVTMSGVTANFDDYLQSLQFGGSISFKLTLSGPAVDASLCGPTSDCSLPGFSLDFLSADGGQFLFTGDPAGASGSDFTVAQVEVGRNGTTTTILHPGPDGPPLVRVTAVPEPAAWALMLAGFGGAGAVLRRRRAAAFS